MAVIIYSKHRCLLLKTLNCIAWHIWHSTSTFSQANIMELATPHSQFLYDDDAPCFCIHLQLIPFFAPLESLWLQWLPKFQIRSPFSIFTTPPFHHALGTSSPASFNVDSPELHTSSPSLPFPREQPSHMRWRILFLVHFTAMPWTTHRPRIHTHDRTPSLHRMYNANANYPPAPPDVAAVVPTFNPLSLSPSLSHQFYV